MMYLSRLSLRRDRDVAALRQLIDPATRAAPIVDAVEQGRRTDAHHRLVWSAFAGQDFDPNERPFLWRADGQGRFMVLSHARPESGGLFDLPEIKEFAPVLAAGDRLHFALRVNATRAVRPDAGNLSTGGKPKRRKNDIVMAMLKDVPKGEARRSARMPMALKAADAWMRKQGEAHGFAPAGKEWLTVEDYSVLALPGAETRKGGGGGGGGSAAIRGAEFVRHAGGAGPAGAARPDCPRVWTGQGLWLRVDADPAGMNGLPPPKPIPLRDRASLVFVERAQLDVQDGAFVAVNADRTRTHIPVGGLAGLMLEPGVRISHAAVALAGRTGTLITWVGEGGVRLYSAGQPGGARSDKLLWQASLALDPEARLRVVRKMFQMRFGEAAPSRRSIDQLRGIEGVRVRKSYELLAQSFGVKWTRRKYDVADWEAGDLPNRCLSAATACLHGLAEAAVLAAGYAPAIGFLHSGKPRSFVYDIADIWKLDTVVPEAFRIAGLAGQGRLDRAPDRAVRLACRDVFRSSGLLKKIIPQIEEVLSAGDLPKPETPEDAIGPAFEEGGAGDDGHRG